MLKLHTHASTVILSIPTYVKSLMSDSTEVSSVQQMMNSIYISLYEFQRYVCAYILNHRRSKIYDQSDVVGIGK